MIIRCPFPFIRSTFFGNQCFGSRRQSRLPKRPRIAPFMQLDKLNKIADSELLDLNFFFSLDITGCLEGQWDSTSVRDWHHELVIVWASRISTPFSLFRSILAGTRWIPRGIGAGHKDSRRKSTCKFQNHFPSRTFWSPHRTLSFFFLENGTLRKPYSRVLEIFTFHELCPKWFSNTSFDSLECLDMIIRSPFSFIRSTLRGNRWTLC
jgi:hypothetical protein